MAVTLDPKVQVALSNMFAADEVYESDKAKVLSAIDEALTTADAAETEQLTELRGVVNKWNALPDPVKQWEYPGAAALQQALADAASSTMVDMTELCNLLLKIQQEAREARQEERMEMQESKLEVTNAIKVVADKAADERFDGAVAGAAADIASGVVSAVGGGLALGKAAQSAKRQKEASKLTEGISPKKGQLEAAQELKAKRNTEIAQLDADINTPGKLTPAQTARAVKRIKSLQNENAIFDKLSGPAKVAVDAGETKIKSLDRLISVDDSYSRALSTMTNAAASVASGTGKATSAVYTKTAEEDDALRNQLGDFRDIYASHEQATAELVQSNASAIEGVNSTLAATGKAAEDTGKNIVRNYN